MDLALALGIAFILGCVAGAIGVHYIHNIASAATRAVTIPAGSVATTPAIAATVATDLQARIAALEAKMTTAAPKT